MDFDFFKGKRIFITGHTGFKGAWLFAWLNFLGAKVLGYSLNPNTTPSLFNEIRLANSDNTAIGDIRDLGKLQDTFNSFKPEIVFHLAAQPLVRLSYAEPIQTYTTNVIGSLNVLEAARQCGSVIAFVNVTTDKCYENRETSRAYIESDPMGGFDMYSSSKGCVEIMSSSYRRSFLQSGYAMATARAGNVIGGGDWALDRLVPDCIRAIESNRPIEIRAPHSIRPWQHVLEPLYGYMLLGMKLFESGTEYAQSFNFVPDSSSVLEVRDVAEKIIDRYGRGRIVLGSDGGLHEAKLLKLDITKVREQLGWEPTYSALQAVEKSADWYSAFYKGKDARMLTLAQIKEFMSSIV